MKILLIKYRNIGDILLSTALISNLRFNFPNAKIDYALNKDCEEMILDNPDINQIISYDRNKVNGLSTLKKIIEELKNIIYIRKQGYDLVINLTEGERGACLALFSKAKNKLGWVPEYELKELVKEMMASDIKLMQKDQYLIEGGYKTFNYFE